MLADGVGIDTACSRRTTKLRPKITADRAQALKIGGRRASSPRSHSAIGLHLLEVGSPLVWLRLLNKFGTFGRIAAPGRMINGMEVLIILNIAIAVSLHAEIQNLWARVLLNCLKRRLVVAIIILVSIFRMRFGVVDATIDLKYVLLFHTIGGHFRTRLGCASTLDRILGSIIVTSVLLHIYVVHGAHTANRIVTIAELVLILQHHLLLIEVILSFGVGRRPMVLIGVDILQFILILLFQRKSLIWNTTLGLLHRLVYVDVAVRVTLCKAHHRALAVIRLIQPLMVVLGKILDLRQVHRFPNWKVHQGVVDLPIMLRVSLWQHFLLIFAVLDQNDVTSHVLIHFLALLVVSRLHRHDGIHSQACVRRLQGMRVGSLSEA